MSLQINMMQSHLLKQDLKLLVEKVVVVEKILLKQEANLKTKLTMLLKKLKL